MFFHPKDADQCRKTWSSNWRAQEREKNDLRSVSQQLCLPKVWGGTLRPGSLVEQVFMCDPIDGCPPGSAVPRILQARTLEWVAISFSNA